MSTRFEMRLELKGLSLIGASRGSASSDTFTAFDPGTGKAVGPLFSSASNDEVERAVRLASEASESFRNLTVEKKSALLGAIAKNLESIRTEIVERAALETGLPVGRFETELGRTCGQLRMFAHLVEEGSWVDARISRAIPDRQPVPRPDVRSMLRPLGPVAIFCASNFPLAFSVAGGDTASALAAGCPAIVVGHTAHPGTAELAGVAIANAVNQLDLPEGIFSLLFSKDHRAGQSLVRHPDVKGVAFTGSAKGGRALMDIAADRENPIPVFAEMSSVNPVFFMPEALIMRCDELAKGFFDSFTLGYGQFCTKPGIVFLVKGENGARFRKLLEAMVKTQDASPLLTSGIKDSYLAGTAGRSELASAAGSEDEQGFKAPTMVFTVTGDEFLRNDSLHEELFGPATLIVEVDSTDDFIKIAKKMEGQLTATVHATEADLLETPGLLDILETKAGRVVMNSFPTGVEVSDAMVHGGPYPATSDSRSTSVGARAVERFCRLVAYQGFPDECLPQELKDANPMDITRKER